MKNDKQETVVTPLVPKCARRVMVVVDPLAPASYVPADRYDFTLPLFSQQCAWQPEVVRQEQKMTDPNTILTEMQKLSEQITAPYSGPASATRIAEIGCQGRILAELFLVFDKWVKSGGYLPRDRQKPVTGVGDD
jgi:hypothetical protein